MMIGRDQKYIEYKDSTIEWLGLIPAHWQTIQLKRTARFITGMTPSTEVQEFYSDDTTPFEWVRPEDINDNSQSVRGSKYLTPLGWGSLRKVRENSTLICCIGTIGKAAYTSKELVTNQQITAVIFSKNTKYYFYVMLAARRQLEEMATGNVVKILNSERLGRLAVPSIDAMEADIIGRFLDHETAKIDTLIANQEKLIELLKEKRQAVISHAVTKGLNPNVPMKDSGVEWLGEVPEHWIVAKFSYEIDFLEGPGILAVDFHDTGVPLLRIQDVKEAFVTDNFKTYLDPQKVTDKWDHFRVNKGDLLISASASTGLISEVDERTVGAIPYTGLIRLRPASNRITKDFIRYIVQSDLFFEQIKLLQTGSTIQHFGPIHLQQMKILLPSLKDQVDICRAIITETSKIDKLIEKAEDFISLTIERRKSVISAAVTGKIDLRDWQV